ncbi:30S ribosomal protein S6 [Loigolactobacillus jiayinensis]|uniref:Small ribosomal subunit protein bS6 n=1 Tax=Loigolactobacillus jiayinensis TaxID=2486016 RepID=A0ABW1RE19_9LACO|nr:30S ribosomal protein S6 [Loigolactobacillus jiayinensis]
MAQSKKYEILYIVRTDIDDDAKTALVERFDSILRDNGAEVVESKDWSKRRLAYEIKNYREGLYHLIKVTTDDDTALNEFDRLAKINDEILRHMITRVEE